MRLGEVMRGRPAADGALEFDVSEDWLQGRSAFGGLQAAFGVAAMRSLLDAPVPLRSLQATFVAPVPPGTVRACARKLRQGRSATQVEADLVRDDERLCTLTGVFGSARESRIAHRPTRPAIAEARSIRFPYLAGLTPAFTQHFAAHWRRGNLPFSGDPSRHSAVELDLLDDGPCGEAHLLAFADFIPPVALSMLATPTPASSLTWLLEVFETDLARLPLEGWRIDSELVAARDGYTSQSNRLWAPDGSLAALSQQAMVVFG